MWRLHSLVKINDPCEYESVENVYVELEGGYASAISADHEPWADEACA